LLDYVTKIKNQNCQLQSSILLNEEKRLNLIICENVRFMVRVESKPSNQENLFVMKYSVIAFNSFFSSHFAEWKFIHWELKHE